MRKTAWFPELVLVLVLAGCVGGGGDSADRSGEEDQASEEWEGDVTETTRTLRPQEGTEADWDEFRGMASLAWQEGLDTVPMGDAMITIGRRFVGTPYAPGTLEVAGEEGVVVNFQELDCVTLVENVLALARFVRLQDPSILESDLRTRNAYMAALREIRYRGGRVDGYPSRLHYFSDWILDNEAKGIVKEMTQEMGGVPDSRAIDYMTNHPDAYRQLANRANYLAIQEREMELGQEPRFKIPEWEIQARESSIEDGDIIAVTSTVEGLDVAHTGLAIWIGPELHLLHAPLVGDSVEVSERPLSERVSRLEGQDGIRVLRVLDPNESGSEFQVP